MKICKKTKWVFFSEHSTGEVRAWGKFFFALWLQPSVVVALTLAMCYCDKFGELWQAKF